MMTRDPFRFFLSVAFVVLILGAWGQAQVIQDPSFEGTGYPTGQNFGTSNPPAAANGWTFGAVAGSNATSAGNINVTTPGSNGVATEHHINVHSSNPGAGNHLFIQTTMNGLVAGQVYIISFQATRQAGANAVFSVFIDGVNSFTTGNIPTSGTTWTTYSFSFTATGNPQQLMFQDTSTLSGDSNWNLDNIQIVNSIIPEINSVGTAALLVIGIGLVDGRRFRRRMVR